MKTARTARRMGGPLARFLLQNRREGGVASRARQAANFAVWLGDEQSRGLAFLQFGLEDHPAGREDGAEVVVGGAAGAGGVVAHPALVSPPPAGRGQPAAPPRAAGAVEEHPSPRERGA